MQRNTGYFPTESLEPSINRLFSRSALNEGYLFRGSLEIPLKEGTVMKKNFLNYLVKACAAYEYSMGWDVAYMRYEKGC